MSVGYLIVDVVVAILNFVSAYLIFMVAFRIVGCRPLTAKWNATGMMIGYCTTMYIVLALSCYAPYPIFEKAEPEPQEIFVVMLWGVLASINCIVMPLFYGIDKRKAVKPSETRIPESVLHFFAFSGGWLGATISQQVFKHKTKKRSFRVVYRASFVVSLLIYSLSIYLSIYGVEGIEKRLPTKIIGITID